MTHAEILKIMDDIKGEVRQGFELLGNKVENVDTRLTKVETTLKNMAWAFLATISIAAIIAAIVFK